MKITLILFHKNNGLQLLSLERRTTTCGLKLDAGITFFGKIDYALYVIRWKLETDSIICLFVNILKMLVNSFCINITTNDSVPIDLVSS